MLKLTEQEKQEIVRYLESGRELPEKYRFLLFEEKREVELVWNGKTSEVCNIVLPFQVIEQVDEPRAEKPEDTKAQFSLFDDRGRQMKGWTNKLIWGDNKLILSSLKNGPLREEIEKQGGLKLIYIDPPFDVGADFSMDIEITPSNSPLSGGRPESDSPLTRGDKGGLRPSPKSPTSWKRSPTATHGAKVPIPLSLCFMSVLLSCNNSWQIPLPYMCTLIGAPFITSK